MKDLRVEKPGDPVFAPATKAGRALLEREALNSRSFALIRPEDIVAIEREARERVDPDHDHDECQCKSPATGTHRHSFAHAHPVEHRHEHEHPTDAMVVDRLAAIRSAAPVEPT